MFERFTERARRAIFFARYEASQYGGQYIETEHLLLGLLKEDPSLAGLLPNSKDISEIRTEVERHIEPRERISTSVEVPLSAQCKKTLHLAAEEASRLASRTVETGHLLLGLLRISDGLAAHIAGVTSADLGQLREKVHATRPKTEVDTVSFRRSPSPNFQQAVESFLAALRDGNLESLGDVFSSDSCFVDACGKLWRGQKEIVANFELLLAPFAKRCAKHASETSASGTESVWVSTLIWEDVHLPGFSPLDLFRMSIVFVNEEVVPLIYLIQITPIGREVAGKSAAS